MASFERGRIVFCQTPSRLAGTEISAFLATSQARLARGHKLVYFALIWRLGVEYVGGQPGFDSDNHIEILQGFQAGPLL
jgi:hypothetical protein